MMELHRSTIFHLMKEKIKKKPVWYLLEGGVDRFRTASILKADINLSGCLKKPCRP